MPHPLRAGGIWKLSFISTVSPTVHTNPSRKRSFWKTLFKPEEFENESFRLRVDRKHLEKRSFYKMMTTSIMKFPCQSFFKLKSKPTVNCYVFKFLRHSVNGKCLMPIQSETSVFNFFWRSADPAPNISVEKLNCQNNPPSLNFNFDSN